MYYKTRFKSIDYNKTIFKKQIVRWKIKNEKCLRARKDLGVLTIDGDFYNNES